MSGGIAYVLDEEGDFERRCNLAMVDLEPVPSENHVMERSRHQIGDLESHGLVDVTDMTRFDEERLHQLIENHLHYTGSARAKAILEDWAFYLPKFVKVMPVEYRRALEEMAKAQIADKSGLGEIEIGIRGNGGAGNGK
jgi:glutamate synthase domain-containing protein 3